MLLLQVLASDTIKVLSVNQPMTFKECFSDPSMIIAGCAVFISLIGLGLALYSAHLTRKHNRLSVEPLIQHTFDHTSDDYVVFLKIENCGLGTAIITKSNIVYKKTSFETIEQLLKKYSPFKCNSGTKRTLGENDYLSSSSSFELFRLTLCNEIEKKKCLNVFKEATLEIEYRSLYGERKEYKHSIHWDAKPITEASK